MMINKTYDLNHIRESVKNSLPLFYLLAAFFMGLLLAVINTVYMSDEKMQSPLMQEIFSYQNIVQYVFLINLLCSLLFFLNGFSMLGKPFTIVLLFVYGFALASYLIVFFRQQNGENILFFFLHYILSSVFYSIAQIAACVQSAFFSSDLYNNYFYNTAIKTKIRTYLKRYILVLIIICSGGMCMSIVAVIFNRFVF